MAWQLHGDYFPPRSSKRIDAVGDVSDTGELVVSSVSGEELNRAAWKSLDISSRIGTTPRRLRFPDDGLFETMNNDGVDEINKAHGKLGGHSAMYHMEKLSKWTIVLVLLTAATVYGYVNFGIPYAAKQVAFALPDDLLDSLSEEVLETLDDRFLGSSELDTETQSHVTSLFDRVVSQADGPPGNYELLFRKGQRFIGANALALPNGTIIITDQMVDLAENDDQIIGVLGHEIAHVDLRHSMRGILQSSVITVSIIFITGDMSGVSEILVAAPALFVNLKYSRDFERESDDRGLEIMKALGADPKEFGRLFANLAASHCGVSDKDGQESDGSADNPDEKAEEICEDGGWLATHPGSKERIERAERASGVR